jgi:SH3-like domain-containing protein
LKLQALYATAAFHLLLASFTLCLATPTAAAAEDLPRGQTSGLPLPRFVSVKSTPVNVRQGPSADYDIAWKFLKAGIPVEVTQEFDVWYKVRDSEGQEGWIQKTLLSGRRTALVSPWDKGDPIVMRDKAAGTVTVARLEHNVLVDVAACDGQWCRVAVEGTRGWVEQQRLWGVYPNEKFE